MAMIEVTDDELKFLQDLGNELRTQDNRSTANPYYFVVGTTELLPAADDHGTGPKQFVDWEGDPDVYYSPEEARKNLQEYFGDEDGAAEKIEKRIENLEEFDTHVIHRHQNVFLTEKAVKSFMVNQSHNIKSHEPPYSYVEYARRNPELRQLLDILRKIK